MSLTISTKTYTADRAYPDSVMYMGPANTLSIRDSIEYKRVNPKPTASDPGKAKPGIRIVRTVTCADNVKRDAILYISGSLPVGISDTDIGLLLTDGKDALALEVANTTSCFKKLKISY